MREHRQIVNRWQQGSGLILATLIRVQGSSYRKPGARLMVSSNGAYEGGVSAGCLEADLLRKASWLIRDGSAIERYSTLFDETTDMPFGLGCGGVLDILLESVETPECRALLQAIESTLARCEHHIVTWLPENGRTMMRAIFRKDGELIFASKGLSDATISEAWIKSSQEGGADLDSMFIERLLSPQRLFVFGAGDDAKPVVTLASLLGWSVTVADRRGHFARKVRFPEDNVEVTSTPQAALNQIDANDAVVIMTHSYEQDGDYLTSVLPLRPRYLGILGSRQRSSLLIGDAAAKLGWSILECCSRICAPIGLDIGGEGPEEIAIAIIAETQAARAGKRNEARKLSAESVDRFIASGDVRRYLHAQCSLGTV